MTAMGLWIWVLVDVWVGERGTNGRSALFLDRSGSGFEGFAVFDRDSVVIVLVDWCCRLVQ